MRKALRVPLARAFEDELTEKLPQFKRRRDVKVPPGDLVFSWSPRPPLTLFVILEVKQDWDSFNVSLAWNAQGEDLVRYAAMLPTDEPIDGKLRFALHRLWDETPARDPWYWHLEPPPRLDDPATWLPSARPDTELVPRAQELARDAVHKVQEVGLPYFQRVLSDSGPSTRPA